MTSTGPGFQLSNLGATTTTAPPATVITTSGFGLPAASSGPTVGSTVGLGGQNQTTVTLTGIQQNGTQT